MFITTVFIITQTRLFQPSETVEGGRLADINNVTQQFQRKTLQTRSESPRTQLEGVSEELDSVPELDSESYSATLKWNSRKNANRGKNRATPWRANEPKAKRNFKEGHQEPLGLMLCHVGIVAKGTGLNASAVTHQMWCRHSSDVVNSAFLVNQNSMFEVRKFQLRFDKEVCRCTMLKPSLYTYIHACIFILQVSASSAVRYKYSYWLGLL